MSKQSFLILLAVIFYSGFFACNTAPKTRELSIDSLKAHQERAKAEKLARPFNCATDESVPLGYIDTGWIYQNPGLGIRFTFPKGWNAMDDIYKSSPTFVPVGGNYYEFRESYLKPRSAGLEGMIRDGWSDPRFMFGFTHIAEPVYSDSITPNYNDSVYAAAYLFYSNHPGEKALYKDVIINILNQWKGKEYAYISKLNQTSIFEIKSDVIGNDTFYTQVLKFPADKGMLHATTSIRRRGCLFVMLIFHYYNEKEHLTLLEGMKGLKLSN